MLSRFDALISAHWPWGTCTEVDPQVSTKSYTGKREATKNIQARQNYTGLNPSYFGAAAHPPPHTAVYLIQLPKDHDRNGLCKSADTTTAANRL
jgi:hypothetical protein